MKNLVNFILRNSIWLVAILLIAFSFYLVFKYNSYQRSVYLSSANKVSGWVYATSNNATSFLHLKKNNRELHEQNAKLQNELDAMKTYIAAFRADSSHTDSLAFRAFGSDSIHPSQFHFISAEVANLTFAGVNNSITLNKGKLDGIKPDMGVISSTGVVGVVSTVSEHFALVIPIINPMFRLSAKLKNSKNYGSIGWNGDDVRYAQLQELPKHETFNKGDTVLTSFSRIFPKGLIIGFVSEQGKSRDDIFNTFNVKLATDFYTLQNVLVIEDKFYQEQNKLEESINR